MRKFNQITSLTIFLLLGLSILATTVAKRKKKDTSNLLLNFLAPPQEKHKQDTNQQCCDSYCCSYCDAFTDTTTERGTTEYSCPDQYRCDECYPHSEAPYCPDLGRCQECWPECWERTTTDSGTCPPELTCPSPPTCPTSPGPCICPTTPPSTTPPSTTQTPCPTQEPCPSCPTEGPTTRTTTRGPDPTTSWPTCPANPQFTKAIYQSSLPSWPLAGTTVHLGIHANTTDGAILRYQLVTTFEFMTLSASQDIIFTSNVADGAFVGPNNVMIIEVAAIVIWDESRTSNAAIALVFPRSTTEDGTDVVDGIQRDN